jgi:hypothetical protein
VPSASLPLSGPGGYSPRRRLPGGASSRYRAVGRCRRGRPGQRASHGVGRRCPAGGVQQAVSTHPVPASGIRLSSRPVSGHLGSSSTGSGGRLSAVHPSGVQPSAVHPCGVQPSGVCPRPSGRVRLLTSGGGVGNPGRGPADVTTGTGGGPDGCRAVDGSTDGPGGRDAGDAAAVAVASGRSVADPGPRVGCGPRRPRLPAERPSRAAARWAREQAAAPGGGTRRVAAVLGWVRDHGAWSSPSLTPGWTAPEGHWRCRRRWACGPSAAQAGSEPSQLAAGNAVSCEDGWWAWLDLNLGPHPYQQSRA